MTRRIKIALLLNFYNGYTGIKRLLDSIPQGFLDYLVAVDGVYRYHKEQNPDLSDISDDGSRELLVSSRHKFSNGVILYNKINTIEFHKRNTYLEACEKLGDIDVGIICDDDEFFIVPAVVVEDTKPEDAFTRFKQNIETAIMKHKNHHNVFSIQGLNLNADPPYDCAHPRVWIHPSEMRYLNGSHYYYGNVVTEKESIETFKRQRYNFVQYSKGIIKGVVLAHSHALRSKQYMKEREEYIEYLKRFEGLVQSHYFDCEQSHRLAMLGIDRDNINIKNKDEIIKKYNL